VHAIGAGGVGLDEGFTELAEVTQDEMQLASRIEVRNQGCHLGFPIARSAYAKSNLGFVGGQSRCASQRSLGASVIGPGEELPGADAVCFCNRTPQECAVTDHHFYDRRAWFHRLAAEEALGPIVAILVFGMWLFSLYAVARGWQ